MATPILDVLNAHISAVHEADCLAQLLVDLVGPESPQENLFTVYFRQLERISATCADLERAVRQATPVVLP